MGILPQRGNRLSALGVVLGHLPDPGPHENPTLTENAENAENAEEKQAREEP